MGEVKTKKLPACPVKTTLTLIRDKWKVLILRDLMPRTKLFGELKKSVGNVTQKVLTVQLRAVEESSLVHREVYAEEPPRGEYSLTVLGESIKPILDSMWAWAKHISQNGKKRSNTIHMCCFVFCYPISSRSASMLP